jgi:hypothetical protein
MKDYANMEAGPELDRLIAKEVMGWEPLLVSDRDPTPHFWHDPSGVTVNRRTHPACTDDTQFRPSTNIAHAWEVVERMSVHHNPSAPALWHNLITGFSTIPGLEDKKSADGHPVYSFTKVLAHAPHLASLAICRAALLAKSAP